MNPSNELGLNRGNNLKHCDPHVSKGKQITNKRPNRFAAKVLPGGSDLDSGVGKNRYLTS